MPLELLAIKLITISVPVVAAASIVARGVFALGTKVERNNTLIESLEKKLISLSDSDARTKKRVGKLEDYMIKNFDDFSREGND